MSKKLKLNKGDLVELSGKEYEVTIVGKNQVTLKNAEGKARRVTLTSPAYAKIVVTTAVEVEEVPEEEAPKKSKAKKSTVETAKKPKKRLGVKEEVKEEIKEVDFALLEQESFNILKAITLENSKEFMWPEENKITSWWYTIQRATKGQRIAYIEWKLEQEGPDSLFGLMIALYKTRNQVKCNYEDFQDRICIDEFGAGERAEELSIKAVLEALKPMLNVSRAKVKQELKDEFILTIPETEYQGWCFYFLNSFASVSGSLKLSEQDLSNIKIPMA